MGFTFTAEDGKLLPATDCDTCFKPVGTAGLVACEVEEAGEGVGTVADWTPRIFCDTSCRDARTEYRGDTVLVQIGSVQDYIAWLCIHMRINPVEVAAGGMGLTLDELLTR